MRFGAWGPEYGGIYPATDKGYYVNLLRKLDIISGGRKDNWARSENAGKTPALCTML